MQDICSETCAKKCKKRLLNLCFCLQMLRNSRYLLVRCAKGLTPSLLDMGVASVNFTQFARVVSKLHEIWLIHSNFLAFSVDGQRSETS